MNNTSENNTTQTNIPLPSDIVSGNNDKKNASNFFSCFDKHDEIFAWIYYMVGYFFISSLWFMLDFSANYTDNVFYWFLQKNIFTIFTIFYIVVVLLYSYKKGNKPATESWFWLVIIFSIVLPWQHWSAFAFLQFIALIFTAAYWTVTVNGGLIDNGKTSHLVFLDVLNSIIVMPLGCFWAHIKAVYKNLKRDKFGRKYLSVILGLCIGAVSLMYIIPSLFKADDNFRQLFLSFFGNFRINNYYSLMTYLLKLLLSLPVTAFLFGLAYASTNKIKTKLSNEETIKKTGVEFRFIPNISIYISMSITCLIYILFIILQSSYLFSAFRGALPVYTTYADYARQGFFELCKVSSINIVILFLCNYLSKETFKQDRYLKFFNVLLSVLTIVLLTTALSKMFMYINAFGLTVKRITTSAFLLWLIVVFILIIISMYKNINLVRKSVLIGAVIFSILCILNIEHIALNYNVANGYEQNVVVNEYME